MKITIFLFSCVLIMSCLANALARENEMAALLPSDSEVTPWKLQSASRTYAGKPEDFTLIYDGGYDVYTKAGAVEGLRQAYRNNAEMEITLHRFSTVPGARVFWAAQRNGFGGYQSVRVSPALAGKAVLLRNGNDYMGLLVQGRYYVTFNLNSSDQNAAKSVDAFIIKCLARIRNHG